MSGTVEQIEAVLHEAEELHGQVYRIVKRRPPRLGIVVRRLVGQPVGAARAPRDASGAQRAGVSPRAPRQGVHEGGAGRTLAQLLRRPHARVLRGSRRPHLTRRPRAAQERRSPVSRTVMLSRPSGRPRPSGAVPGNTLGTPWKMRRFSPPEHEQVAAAHLDVDERPGAPVDAGEAERARVAEADGHDRRVRWLLAVLVQAERGAGRVEVDDRGVGLEPRRLGAVGAVGVGHRSRGQRVDARRAAASPARRRCRRRCACTRRGASASRGTPTARSSAARSARAGGGARRAAAPTAGTLARARAGRRAQPVRDVHDSRHHLPGDANRLHGVEGEAHLATSLRRRRAQRQGHRYTAASTRRPVAPRGRSGGGVGHTSPTIERPDP